MLWMCQNCKQIFRWVRHGEETKPNKCPVCGSDDIESLEW